MIVVWWNVDQSTPLRIIATRFILSRNVVMNALRLDEFMTLVVYEPF